MLSFEFVVYMLVGLFIRSFRVRHLAFLCDFYALQHKHAITNYKIFQLIRVALIELLILLSVMASLKHARCGFTSTKPTL